ncbi:MAG: hypothetical protein IT546_09705 [Caulobacteraceae bacterium]|nr:hypothetical protein [Caulobacteraceae bacterium]
MSRPKPTPEDDAAREARIDRYGRSDSDISDEEHAHNIGALIARLKQEAKGQREDRRRLKAAQGAASEPPR